MTTLISSDWHLTDSPHDEYRWGIFPWIKEQVKKHKIDNVVVAGDLTDRKDGHSSFLTNRICDAFVDLAEHAHVILMKGNHDFIDEGVPFFKFINQLNNPCLRYIIEPSELTLDGKKCLFLPCTRNHTEVWEGLDFSKYEIIFCHETFQGAISESGISLDGISRSIFENTNARIISGDVHVPQLLGNITYCGSPYRIRFGDSFDGRVLLLNGESLKDLHYPCLKKHTIELFDTDDRSWVEAVKPGDYVKFRMMLKRSEVHDWEKQKQILLELAKASKVVVHGIEIKLLDKQKKLSEKTATKNLDPMAYFEAYCKREKISGNEKEIGNSLLCS